MFTSLDLLIIVVMALAAASLLALALMFLIKNKTVQRVCFYIVVALGVYIGTVGFRINWPGFILRVGVAVVLALVCIGALVLERVKKNDDRLFLLARVMAAVGLLAGMVNAFLV